MIAARPRLGDEACFQAQPSSALHEILPEQSSPDLANFADFQNSSVFESDS